MTNRREWEAAVVVLVELASDEPDYDRVAGAGLAIWSGVQRQRHDQFQADEASGTTTGPEMQDRARPDGGVVMRECPDCGELFDDETGVLTDFAFHRLRRCTGGSER